jgi:chromosome segregation ATPase
MGKQVFVKIEEYKELAELIDASKSKIRSAKELLSHISKLKAQEDKELERWEAQLEEIESGVSDIDKKLEAPEGP